MKWSETKVAQLRTLANAGTSNKEIARKLGVGINEVYAKRSQLGITIDKVKAAQAEMVIGPEVEKTVQDMDDRAAFRAKQELIRLLEPAIILADSTVKELSLVDDGKVVEIRYKSGSKHLAFIEGDSLMAIISDVTRKCLF